MVGKVSVSKFQGRTGPSPQSSHQGGIVEAPEFEWSASIRVAGVDEAGRGPLAGPLAVAAVMLDPSRPISGLNDSKKLSEARREVLFAQIIERALAYCIVLVEPEEIDRLNIFQATMAGMSRAVAGLVPAAAEALIDGNQLPRDLPCRGRAIIGGDALEPAISAASILAKVTRDRLMVKLDSVHPGYGFATHKGYPTAAHLVSLRQLGPCVQHRRSFAPVRVLLDQGRLF
ncbi:MAG: ribonuclease HII [Rhodanobacter sp.]|nr:MAG: ribonuclease HII [Rhodanobacter sp.]TAL99396.1 MAG: ribonuclease HII [Rhodanobacter sp.]TAM43170.1 MAG: ribonuclease HII [Rhodanobacter sp.]TAN26380.1 MAG: ribonuclease HII [Rhodanobacter sp.]